MTETVSVGILGAGNIGSIHLQTASALDGVRLRAVADVVPEHRTRARRLGAEETYADYADLLAAESLDAVVVALPPFLHASAAIEAARAGCHVFVEKPFARTAEEGRDVLAAADRNGVSVGVDHTLRYLPEIQAMKAAYDEGRIGRVPLATFSRVNDGPLGSPPVEDGPPDWQLDPDATGGGVVFDLGVHLFDLAEWFFGDVTVAHAETRRTLDLPYEDAATVVLTAGETDTVVTVNCGFFQWESPPEFNLDVRLEGVTDVLENRAFAPTSMLGHAATAAVKNVGRRLRGKRPTYFDPTYYYRAHHLALAEFLQAVADDETPPVPGSLGLKTVELAEATYEAAGRTPASPASTSPVGETQ